VLILLVLLYAAVFSMVSILNFRNFGMSAYDIGIHAQAIWKLSTGRGLFNTVRGLPIWGDHCWFIMLLYAPLYRLIPRVETLLALQSLGLALGALPLAALVLRRQGGRLAAVVFAMAWLLSPALQNMNLENFHPEVLAAPLLLWAVERADALKWRGYWIALGLALLCKEDVALTTFVLGFWVFFRNRRAGILTLLLSLAWFFLCMKVFLPYFNEHGFFRFQSGYWFSTFWEHKFDPGFYWSVINQARVGRYSLQLGLPLLFIFLLNPLLAAAALPAFMVNVLSANDYLISIEYHYNFQTLPMLFAASAISFAWIRRQTKAGPFVAGLALAGILGASVWANNLWSLLPVNIIQPRITSQLQYFKKSGTEKRFREFVALLPQDPDVPVAVSHNLLPHLANRDAVYMFPNPFKPQYWGIQGENLPPPQIIEMVLLDTNAIGPDNMAVFKGLIRAGAFFLVKQEGSLMLAQKAENGLRNPVTDPMDMAPPPADIRLLVYLHDTEVKFLTPIWGRTPDLDVRTEEMRLPLTRGELLTAEGLSLGARDNLRLFFLGRWHAEGMQQVFFRLKADDGCRLYIDGSLALDYEGVHSYGRNITSAPLQLDKGFHVIALDYFEWGGEAGVQVEWAGAGGEFQVLKVGQQLP